MNDNSSTQAMSVTRLKQAAVLFEVIAVQASTMEQVLTMREETRDPESMVRSVEYALAQIGLMADFGTGLANGSDVPNCRGGVAGWLMPPAFEWAAEQA